jgi:acyl-CoA reductase-like NAD-dependent aldehyde dehydrogenase
VAGSGRIIDRVTEQALVTTPTTERMVIGGDKVDALDGQTFEVLNPATGEAIARVPLGGPADVDRAVQSARKAFEGAWSTWSAAKRGRTLAKLADLVRRNQEELAQLESRNVGKPITAARGEVFAVGLVFDYYAGATTKHFGETIPVSKPGLDFTLREPIGVVGLIRGVRQRGPGLLRAEPDPGRAIGARQGGPALPGRHEGGRGG